MVISVCRDFAFALSFIRCEITLRPCSHVVFASKFNNVSMGLEPFFDFVFCMCEHLLLLPKIPLFALNKN